jgi:Fe-S cluster biogenesis protein NfuA
VAMAAAVVATAVVVIDRLPLARSAGYSSQKTDPGSPCALRGRRLRSLQEQGPARASKKRLRPSHAGFAPISGRYSRSFPKAQGFMSSTFPTTEDGHQALRARIEAVLDEYVRPGLRADGGEIELVGIDADNIVQVRLQGACQGCPSAVITLTMGVEAELKRRIPEIRFLEAVP